MNASDILKYGHLTILKAIEGLPEKAWDTGGVCGVWSVKDIMAHLASYEYMLVDIFNSLNGGPTPTLDQMFQDGPEAFNDNQVALYRQKTVAQVVDDYKTSCQAALQLAAALPTDRWRQNGILAWYGAEYDLEDYIVYTFYGHKREHSAQIAVFRDTLK